MWTRGHQHAIDMHTMNTTASEKMSKGAELMGKGKHAKHRDVDPRKLGVGVMAGMTVAATLASPMAAMADENPTQPDSQAQAQAQATDPIQQAQTAVDDAQAGLEAARQAQSQAQSTVSDAQSGVDKAA